MKKLFFAFVATSVVVLSACNNKQAETTDATAVDTAAVTTAVAAVVDSAAAMATDTAAAAAPAK